MKQWQEKFKSSKSWLEFTENATVDDLVEYIMDQEAADEKRMELSCN